MSETTTDTPDELEEGVSDEPEHEPEPEEDEEVDESPEPEPATEDEPQATSSATSPEEIERRMKALEKENLRHATRVGAILEEDATDLEKCPRCAGFADGFIFPVGMAPITPEQRAAVKASIGEGSRRQLKKAKDAYRCPDCDGAGVVDTDSDVDGQGELICRDCNGRGWVGPRAPEVLAAQVAGTPNGGAVPATPAQEGPEPDPWGRAPDHPDYGRLPNYATVGARV